MVDKVIVDRFENVLTKGRVLLTHHKYKLGQVGDRIKSEPFAEWRTQSQTLIAAVFGSEHIYTQNFDQFTTYDVSRSYPAPHHVQSGLGTLQAAAEDHAKGYIWTLRERVHADVFDDFLEMAASLVSDGYTTAAAVMAGSTLEEHLRKLCKKHGIDVTVQKRDGAVEPKKASAMNDDLLKQSVYLKGEWRLNQGWLDIRNDCAHNLSTKYDDKQLRQMIDGIRGFSARHPA